VAKWAANNDERHDMTLSNLRLSTELWLEMHCAVLAKVYLPNSPKE